MCFTVQKQLRLAFKHRLSCFFCFDFYRQDLELFLCAVHKTFRIVLMCGSQGLELFLCAAHKAYLELFLTHLTTYMSNINK